MLILLVQLFLRFFVLVYVTLQFFSIARVRALRQKLFVLARRTILQAHGVIQSGEQRVCFGLAVRLKSTRFVQLGNGLRALLQGQVRLAQQEMSVSGIGARFSCAGQWLVRFSVSLLRSLHATEI